MTKIIGILAYVFLAATTVYAAWYLVAMPVLPEHYSPTWRQQVPASKVVVHRGTFPGQLENSLATISSVLARFPNAEVEIDVQETKDGKFVLLHDADLDRETTGKGLVTETMLRELLGYARKDRAGGATLHRIAQLEQVLGLLERYPKARLQIDAKLSEQKSYEALAESVVSWRTARNRITISSGNARVLQALRQHYPLLRLGFDASAVAKTGISARITREIIEWLDAIGVKTVYLDYLLLAHLPNAGTEDFIRQLHIRGYEVVVWTVDNPLEFSRMLSLHVDKIIPNRANMALTAGR